LFGVAGTANAALVDSNEAGLGVSADGNNLTLDTVTGFYWLDIDIFYGETYPSVESTLLANPAYSDFVIAARDDVGTFFEHLGLTVTNWPNNTQIDEAGSGAYLSALAHTGGTTGNGGRIYGFTSTADGPNKYIATARYTVHTNHGHGNHHQTGADNTHLPTASDAAKGTWIYRSGAAVPEPSSLAMFGIGAGVMGLVSIRRRRREQKQAATA